MARQVNSRLKITGELIAETPLHVGGHGDSFETDMALARNGRDEFYVPGTSLTGSLRSWFEKSFPDYVDAIWGYQEGDDGHASFVLIEDLRIPDELQTAVQSELRDGVGIDRFYGTAAERAKFDRAILPKGTKLNLEMTVEIQDGAERIKATFGHLLEALQRGQIRLGGAKTRGLGKTKLVSTKIEEFSLNGFEAMLNTVEQKPSKTYSIHKLKEEDSSTEPRGSQLLNVKIHWKPRLPVMVKAGYDGIGVDMLPLTSRVDKDNVALVLPGSSIKGVLRSHAERIIRTVLPNCDSTKGKDFHEQIDSIPIVEELFGSRSKSEREKSNPEDKEGKSPVNPKLGLGALAVDDCYAKELHKENGKEETYWMDADTWRKVETALDDKPKAKQDNQSQRQPKTEAGEVSYFKRELWQYLREIDERKGNLTEDERKGPTKRFSIEHHVAIDRWTGGAAEGALYSVLAPNKIEWEPMRFTLDFARIQKESQLPALMLLLLTFRDVAENRLPFGFATNRGMGEIEVTGFEFSGSGQIRVKKLAEQNGEIVVRDEEIDIDLKDALSATVEDGKCKFSDGTLKEQLQMRWRKWLK